MTHLQTCGVATEVAFNESIAITLNENFNIEVSVTLIIHVESFWISVYENSPSIVTLKVSPGSVMFNVYNDATPTVTVKVSLASITGGKLSIEMSY